MFRIYMICLLLLCNGNNLSGKSIPAIQSSPLTEQTQQNSSIQFTDITFSSGTAGYCSEGYGHGISFADVDQDGLLDFFVSNAVRELIIPDLLYINTCGGSVFYEEASSRGVADAGLTHSIVSADFDNDGDLDVFYSNMPVYEDKHLGYGRNALYQNDSDGYFSDITDWAGLSDELNDNRGALALDINNDGWLDLFAVTWGDLNEMYLNDGTEGMEGMIRVSRGADGPSGDTSAKQGVTAADFDNDGDVDIYVCRCEVPNWLFVNDGDIFNESAQVYGVDVGGRSHGAVFVDMDNDADLDLFVVNYALSGSSTLPPLYVFENLGDGSFIERTQNIGLNISGYSLSFGDVDNDADLDMLLLYNNDKDPGAQPRLYLNDGLGHFTTVANSGVEVPANDARSCAFGDIDNDGDLDLYIACKDARNYLLRNDLNTGNHYLDIVCIGPGGDYGGFGSKVYLYESGHLGDADYLLGYQESVSNYAYLCQNQTALHFGLGSRGSCDLRLVQTNGNIIDYENVSADQFIEVPDASNPIAVTICSFNALLEANDQVILCWQTQNEGRIAGFYIQRRQPDQKEFIRLNDHMLLAHGGEYTYQFIDSHVPILDSVYRLEIIYLDGGISFSKTIQAASLSGLSKNPNLPFATRLEQNYPNPFNSSTTISFVIPHDEHVRLEITDQKGCRVKTLLDEYKSTGHYTVVWDGNGTDGRHVVSGCYLYQLQTTDCIHVGKMVVLQ